MTERELAEARMERDREGLHAAVIELRHTLSASFDPRTYIRERPLAWTLGAFVVGYWLGRRSS